jgi:anhydro-N-acetylmuramic acid kinase
MAENELYIGLISGTSVDGVDSVLVNFQQDTPELIASHSHPIEDPLRKSVLALCLGENIQLSNYGQTHIELGKVFADAANALLNKAGVEPSAVTAIGSHGQTVWHEPDADNPFTLQLGDASTIAQCTGITTVSDMRGRDISAGGQGAPLAPLLHQHIFAAADERQGNYQHWRHQQYHLPAPGCQANCLRCRARQRVDGFLGRQTSTEKIRRRRRVGQQRHGEQ